MAACSQLSDGEAKVHFQVDQLIDHNLEIVVKQISPNKYDVHLGFLQIFHHYELQFSFQDDLSEDLTSNPLQNLHVKLTDVQPTEDGLGHEVLINMTAYKEKLMKEKITLMDKADNNKTLDLYLNARVLGKGKGTPALKNGIRCVGIDMDMDSDAGSDWQGFD